jgi:hypothetical protein
LLTIVCVIRPVSPGMVYARRKGLVLALEQRASSKPIRGRIFGAYSLRRSSAFRCAMRSLSAVLTGSRSRKSRAWRMD